MAADTSTFSIVFPAAMALGGTIVGVIGGGLATYWVQRWQSGKDRADKRRALAAGVAAELIAFIDLVEERDHTSAWKGTVAAMRQGHDLKLAGNAGPEGTVKEMFPFFFAQINSIGLLGDQTPDLAKFYTRLAGIYATMSKANKGAFDSRSLDGRITVLETEIALWENTLKGGRAVAVQLQAIGQSE